MFRYELVNSTRKFTIVAVIVSLLKKIYKRDAPFRAVFKVKTLAVLFSPYPREMKHLPRNLNLPPFWRLLVSIEMVQSIPTRALSRARGLSMRTHLTAVGLPPAPGSAPASDVRGPSPVAWDEVWHIPEYQACLISICRRKVNSMWMEIKIKIWTKQWRRLNYSRRY